MKSKNTETMREEIERRVSAFRERQQRFNKVRDDYFKQTVARARDDLKRIDMPPPQEGDEPPSRVDV